MLVKSHQKSCDIYYLESLEERRLLTEDEMNKLISYRKGYAGEVQFMARIKDIDLPVVWDLYLDSGGSVQFDFIVVGDGKVFHFDIKNFSGTYQYADGNLVKGSKVIKDLRPQLNRAHQLLGDALRRSGYFEKVQSRIVFINDTFSWVGYNGDHKVVLPGQVVNITDYLEKQTATTRDFEIARYLADMHQQHNKYQTYDVYPLEDMKPGLRCSGCRKILSISDSKWREYKCPCGVLMKRDELMMDNIAEMELLKNDSFSIQEVMWWTGASKSTCLRFLNKYCEKTGIGRGVKYVMKKENTLLK